MLSSFVILFSFCCEFTLSLPKGTLVLSVFLFNKVKYETIICVSLFTFDVI
jgi:hypothetical protein